MVLRVIAVVFVVFGLSACGSDDPQTTPMNSDDLGKRLYEVKLDGGNAYSCSACHGLNDEGKFKRPGHPLIGATTRTTFKNGALTSFSDAVNSCLTEWMNAEPWAEDSDNMTALVTFLEETAPGTNTEVAFSIVDVPADLTGGDKDAGQTLFNDSCAVCHGNDAGGSPLAPALGGLNLEPGYIAERIRKSGRTTSNVYDGLTGGIMPFWSAERLTDANVVDLVAFVVDAEVVEPEPNNGVDNNGVEPNNGVNPNNMQGRTCESTHSRVGHTLSFSTLFHGVSGTATVVDDCTIEITGFNYDGAGIEIRVWTGAGSPPNYDAGYGISEDLFKSGGYTNESLTLQLTEEQSLDDIDGLSIWCVGVGISFGDGTFSP